jgi:TRAP-type uncharacterized transport system fused permease subunit
MLTSQGFALITELFAAVLLVAALSGFFVRRSRPWLVGALIAFMILIVALTVIIDAST